MCPTSCLSCTAVAASKIRTTPSRHPVAIVPPSGEVLVPLAEDEVRAAAEALKAEGIEAVAICFLFPYLNPAQERRAAEIVREVMPDAFVTASADIVPQFREFERFTTALMNAFIGPKTGNYIERLDRALRELGVIGDLHVMMSSGGVASTRGRLSPRPRAP
jgi:N-methylhydantoinase A